MYQGIALIAEQVKTVKEKTRDQSGSKLGFQLKAGRVTASKLRSVLYTKVTNPSKSLQSVTLNQTTFIQKHVRMAVNMKTMLGKYIVK